MTAIEMFKAEAERIVQAVDDGVYRSRRTYANLKACLSKLADEEFKAGVDPDV